MIQGFEPATLSLGSAWGGLPLSYFRSPSLPVRNAEKLNPEYDKIIVFERETGIEPATLSLGS